MGSAYEQEWIQTIKDPERDTRLRFGMTTISGAPVEFLVQLEYYYDGEWSPVARFDHERDGPQYRDVRKCGLHLDVYDPNGNQIRKLSGFSPLPANKAVPTAEQYLNHHYEN